MKRLVHGLNMLDLKGEGLGNGHSCAWLKRVGRRTRFEPVGSEWAWQYSDLGDAANKARGEWAAARNLSHNRAAGDRRAFPPSVMVEIKALACELPVRRGLPLAHW